MTEPRKNAVNMAEHRGRESVLGVKRIAITVPNSKVDSFIVSAEMERARHYVFIAESGTDAQLLVLSEKRVAWAMEDSTWRAAIEHSGDPLTAELEIENIVRQMIEAKRSLVAANVEPVDLDERIRCKALIVAHSYLAMATYRWWLCD